MKHTPGPWHSQRFTCPPFAEAGTRVYGNNGAYLALVQNEGDASDGDVCLIVASPVLLEALKAAAEHLDYCGYGDRWEREVAAASNLREQIEDAIQKAEGADNGS